MKSPERRIESLSKVIYSLSVKKNIYFDSILLRNETLHTKITFLSHNIYDELDYI